MSDWNLGLLAGDTAGGAAAGTPFGPWGTAIGGVVGLGEGLTGEATTPSYDDIYNQLMSQYTSSPAYQQQQAALQQLQGQTITGPTAQEKSALLQAYNSVNQQFNSQYGQIQQNLSRTQGTNSSTQAALLASQGAGESDQMAQMAEGAASQEDARRQSAIQAYQQATSQAMQIQDQYRQWASGQAYQRNTGATAASQGVIAATDSLAGQIGAYTNRPAQPFNLNSYQAASGEGALAGGGFGNPYNGFGGSGSSAMTEVGQPAQTPYDTSGYGGYKTAPQSFGVSGMNDISAGSPPQFRGFTEADMTLPDQGQRNTIMPRYAPYGQ